MGKTKVSNNHWSALTKKSSDTKAMHRFFELLDYNVSEPGSFYFFCFTILLFFGCGDTNQGGRVVDSVLTANFNQNV